jgi:CheY-like chemotaxis protein
VPPPVKVLVIDDEMHIRRLISRILEPVGFVVVTAANGQEALEYLAACQNKAESLPNVITCDISLPDINGFDVLQALKNNPALAHLPVIILTALGQSNEATRAKKEGASAYLTKPFGANTLINMIREHAL